MEEEVKTPGGRAAISEAYGKANPGSPEPDDDTLYGFADSRYSDLDKKYTDLNGANTRLAELVSKDPKFGAVLSMISGEKPRSFPYSVAKVYGKEPFDLEGDALDEFEKGYQEHLKQLAESEKEREAAMKNIEGYKEELIKFGKEKSLSDRQLGEIDDGIMQLADNILTGNIPKELIDLVYKGLNYEKDVKEAADTGYVEGKNTVAEAKMKEKTSRASVPDFAGGSGSGKEKRELFQPRPTSVYDNLKEIKE